MSKRLNKYMREAFVRAVINDVPTVDYDEQIFNTMQKAACESMPPLVKVLFDNPTMRRAWLGEGCYRHYRSSGFYLHCATDWKITDDLKARLDPLIDARIDQRKRVNDLRRELEGMIKSVTTVKSARKHFPEFIKYLPDDTPEPVKDLPVANVVANLVKAGWPKSK